MALALAVYASCRLHGVPEMISELYYRERHGWVFALLLAATGAAMMPVMLDKGGWQWAAFLTCAGLILVGVAPAYLEGGDRAVHKGAAMSAAMAAVVWCMSAGACRTVALAVWGCLAGLLCMYAKGGMKGVRTHWLFAAEVAAMAMVAVVAFG